MQDLKSGEIVEITDTDIKQFRGHVNDVHPMWGADGMLYFASERDGTFNIWRTSPKGGTPEQVTRHKEDGVQFPSASPDGRRIIYENEFALWTLDVPNGRTRQIPIAMAFDPKENDVDVVTANGRAEGFAPAPTGDYVAVEYHGEIVIVPTENGIGEKVQITSSPWRERFQTYSPDGKRIAYVSDESGEEEVWLFNVATSARQKLTTHESVKADLTWAPNSLKLAFTAWNRINADVYLYDVRAKREYNVTKNPFNDTNGRLTPDGQTLVFTSSRDAGTAHLFAVSLARLNEDPNDPLVRERMRRGQPRERPDTAAGAAQGAAAPAPAAAPLRIDEAGIERRAVQLTRGTVGVSSFFLSRDGRTIYFATGAGGGFGGGGQQQAATDSSDAGLFSIGVDGRDRRRITGGVFTGMVPTADRRTIFFRRQPRGGDEDAPGGGQTSGFEIHRLTIANPQRAERVNFSFPVHRSQGGMESAVRGSVARDEVPFL